MNKSREILEIKEGIYSHRMMMEDLEQLEILYSPYFQMEEVAISEDNRSIVDVILGNLKASKHILIQGSIHGREHMNTLVAIKQIKSFLEGIETEVYEGKRYEDLWEQICFHIIPMSNPDGVTISQYGVEGIQSKDMRRWLKSLDTSNWKLWKANGRGVDLNRNFKVGWEEYRGKSEPGSEGYKGTCPVSERETQAILKVAARHKVCCVISYHSAGNIIYWDYRAKGELYKVEKVLAKWASRVLRYPMVSTTRDNVDAAGCSDYFVLGEGIPAITIENGVGECPLPIEKFPDIWKRNDNLLPALAMFCLEET